MKIRCQNCYKVLKKNEEYCTHCGEHSDEVAMYMAEGKHELDATAKFKLSLIIYLCIAFAGTGVLMITFALVQNKLANTYDSNICKALSFIITSIVLFLVLVVINFKEIKTMLFNSTIKQLLLSLLIGMVAISIIVISSKLAFFLRIVPNYMLDFINDEIVLSTDVMNVSNIGVIIALLLSVVSQEIIFRRRLIDALDEDTLLGDKAVVIVSALVGTFLDFIWIMSIETIIMVFLLNILMSAIYINTNRSIAINIFLRMILICMVILI